MWFIKYTTKDTKTVKTDKIIEHGYHTDQNVNFVRL